MLFLKNRRKNGTEKNVQGPNKRKFPEKEKQNVYFPEVKQVLSLKLKGLYRIKDTKINKDSSKYLNEN